VTAPDLLTVSDVSIGFGGILALSDVSLTVAAGSVTAIIGPNGAGKTTLFYVISNFYRPQAGSVLFDGTDILRLPTHARSRIGIARTFQNIALFTGMTVLENIKLGAHAQLKTNVFSAGLYFGWARREEAALAKRIDDDMETVMGLSDHVVVLNFGRVIAAGPAAVVQQDPDVISAYLGDE
jgi:branched-chain amino acid transport system ATP-binding protein